MCISSCWYARVWRKKKGVGITATLKKSFAMHRLLNVSECYSNDDLNKLKLTMENNYDLTYMEVLYDCIRHQCPNIWNYLLQNIRDVNELNEDYDLTLLHHACKIDNFEFVKRLCDRPDMQINTVDPMGRTALHMACNNNTNASIVKYLIGKNADINVMDIWEQSPLSYACKRKAHRIVAELRSHSCTIIDETNVHVKTYMDERRAECRFDIVCGIVVLIVMVLCFYGLSVVYDVVKKQ